MRTNFGVLLSYTCLPGQKGNSKMYMRISSVLPLSKHKNEEKDPINPSVLKVNYNQYAVQCYADITEHPLSLWPQTRKVNGGHLNPGSFTGYSEH